MTTLKPSEVVDSVGTVLAPVHPSETKVRPIPEDPGEMRDALAIPSIMVRPVIEGLSKMFEAMKVSPLDKQEKDAGVQAGAMLAYQYGMLLDGRVALVLFALSIIPPRVIEYLDKRSKEREAKTVIPTIANIQEARDRIA